VLTQQSLWPTLPHRHYNNDNNNNNNNIADNVYGAVIMT